MRNLACAITLVSLSPANSLAEVFQPKWTQTMGNQSDNISVYSVGFAESDSLNKAMTDSWNAAVLNAVRTNIPELIDISELSSESLRGADFDRRSATELDRIKIKGMSEADDKGSPFVTKKGDTYRIWRLARWNRTGIEASKSTIIDRESQSRIIKASYNERQSLRVTKAANKDAETLYPDDRYQYISTVLNGIKCGTTIDQVIELLGEPDEVHADSKSIRYGVWIIYVSVLNETILPRAIHSAITGNRIRNICR